jgi:propionate CoA-transferase
VRTRTISAAEAASMIPSDATVIVGGSGGIGVPDAILEAIAQRFVTDGQPSGLTAVHTTGVGDFATKGLGHLAHKGLLRRTIGGNYGPQPRLMKLIVANEIEAYNLPQGVLCQLYRAIAAHQPGVVTHVGLHTYMDPRQTGGRMNDAAREHLIELVELAGREWLFYKAFKPDFAILRGTTADEEGNIALEHEAATLEGLSIAQAVHNAGGKVIVQVKRVAARGAIHPQLVRIPCFLVDAIVVVPEAMQTFGTPYDPSLSGDERRQLSTMQADRLGDRRVIARRGAMELSRGAVVNLGVGISTGIPNVCAEEQLGDDFVLTVESGVIGGLPATGLDFGSAYNPRAIVDQPYQFDFYDGGGLDIAFLSFAELDAAGHVNVTRFGSRADGCGGFINISQNAKRVVFLGTLTGGAKIEVGDGRMRVLEEGGTRKTVPKVREISFNGEQARATGRDVLYVTERSVMRLTEQGMVLTEIAPGLDLERDVLAAMGFRPVVSPDLHLMDARLFRDGPMGLAAERG